MPTEPTLADVHKEVLAIKEVVLDLQERQKSMESRQQAIKDEIPPAQTTGSFATGYQKE